MSSSSSASAGGRRNLYVPPPCPHVADYRSNAHGLAKPFRSLQPCLRVRPLGRPEIHRDPHEIPRCGPCSAAGGGGDGGMGPRLYAYLACTAVCCPAHAPSNAEECRPGHEIAVDVDRAKLFCCACSDQVYDREFDKAVVLAQIASVVANASTSCPLPESLRKRRRVDYRPWTPDPREWATMRQESSPLLLPDASDPSSAGAANTSTSSPPPPPWGLRGLTHAS